MATLTCDICDGKLVIGAGGVATCEECGMEHTKERLKEKASKAPLNSVAQTQKTIESLLQQSEEAFKKNEHSTSESLADRVLLFDSTNWRALQHKGRAVVWQSTVSDVRHREACQYFSDSLQNAPDNEYDELANQASAHYEITALLLIQEIAQEFFNDPSNTEDFIAFLSKIRAAVAMFYAQTGIERKNFEESLSNQILGYCQATWEKTILPLYEEDDYPDAEQFETLIDDANACCEMLFYIIENQRDKPINPKVYELLITIHEYCCSACAWALKRTSRGSEYVKANTLPPSEVTKRKNLVAGYRKLLAPTTLPSQPNLSKITTDTDPSADFWKQHPDLRARLSEELKKLRLLLEIPEVIDSENLEQEVIDQISQFEAFEDLSSIEDLEDFEDDLSSSLEFADLWHTTMNMSIKMEQTRNTYFPSRKSIMRQIAEQDAIIATSKGFFGEPARIRKEAQRKRDELRALL